MVTLASAINLGIPEMPQGVPDDLFSQFRLVYQAFQNLQRGIEDYSGRSFYYPQPDQLIPSFAQSIQSQFQNVIYAPANQALVANKLAALINSSGVLKVDYASASSKITQARGVIISDTAAGEMCPIFLSRGYLTGYIGLTVAAQYFLATTPGGITSVAPSSPGTIIQDIGFALSPTELYIDIHTFSEQHP